MGRTGGSKVRLLLPPSLSTSPGTFPPFPTRASHSDELVLQLWLGDDVHLDCVKQLPGDEVFRDLGRGVARGPLVDLGTRQSTLGDPQGLSPLVQRFSCLPSTQTYYYFVFPNTCHVLTCFPAFAYAVSPTSHTTSPSKFLSIQEYYWTARPRLSWDLAPPLGLHSPISHNHCLRDVCPVTPGAWDLGLSILSVHDSPRIKEWYA